ncbi:MAG: hypothetical protein KAU62_14565 [Candidatus Heimdallarchaeota archaeon]|nr:hypothetical protein [Candidatus Heimdallarchaeota archaeon]MCG3257318.1 hypothetical protein [Candidatus Heimdallarchaeota archaeon]MCK4612374.1 hypothetical protein [Candidatus Heimdallarchaeota archaeon]
MRSLQLSLVTSSGILLASKPEILTEMQHILASSLISAIITFAKEVHRQELQSISYHDKNISFVQIYDFIIIIETKVEETLFSDRQLAQIIEQIRISAEPLLSERDPDLLSEGESALILEHTLHDMSNLPLFFAKNPLISSEPLLFSLVKFDETDIEIIETVGKKEDANEILDMLKKYNLNVEFEGELSGILLLTPEKKYSALVIVNAQGPQTILGILRFPRELDYIAFRIFPLIQEKLKIISEQDNQLEMLEILDIIQNIEDPGNHFSTVDIEDLSLAFLKNAIGGKLDSILYPIITGENVIIVGDKLTSRLVIDTLSIFNQHIASEIIRWMDDEIDEVNLDTGLFGMSLTQFEKLNSSEKIPEEATIVNLIEGETKGHKESNHFIALLDKLKDQDLDKASVVIFNELRKLVSMSYIITSFSLYDKEQTEMLFRNLFQHSGFPASFVNKATELALKRNPLLTKIV